MFLFRSTFFIAILTSCQLISPSHSSTTTSAESAPQQSYAQQWNEDEIDTITMDTMTPEQVFRNLGARPAGAERQVEFLIRIFSEFYRRNPSIGFGDVLKETFGLSTNNNPRLMIDGDLDESIFRDWAEVVYRRLDRNPEQLNYFPTLRLKHISNAHQTAFANSNPNPNPIATSPFPSMSTDNRIFQLRTSGCIPQQPKTTTQEYLPELGIYKGSSYIDNEISDCFHHNSTVLAEVLNRLANTIVGNSIQTRLRIDAGTVADVRSYRELLRYLNTTIDQFEFFSTRSITDFLQAMYSENQDTYLAIRMPVWFRVRMKDREIRIPAEQTKLNLSLYRNGKRFAQLQYNLETPSNELARVGPYWGAHWAKDFAWYGTHHEFVDVFTTNLTNLEQWLSSVAHSMRGFQSKYSEFQTPFNSYGASVCSDSSTLAIAKYGSTYESNIRKTYAFPNIRAMSIDMVSPQEKIDFEQTIAKFASIPNGYLTNTYPTDQFLETFDPDGFAKRLKLTFSPATIDRYKYFPELKTTIQHSILPGTL